VEFYAAFLDAFIALNLSEYELSIVLSSVTKQRLLEWTSCFSKGVLMQVFYISL